MGIEIQFKTTVYCDCEECPRSIHEEYLEFLACKNKTQAFKWARAEGWTFTKNGKSYAPGHNKPRNSQPQQEQVK